MDFCIICQTPKRYEILSSTDLGRNKIITSSRIIQDNLLEGMSENNFSVIKYHSNSCYKPYCLKSRRSEEGNKSSTTSQENNNEAIEETLSSVKKRSLG